MSNAPGMFTLLYRVLAASGQAWVLLSSVSPDHARPSYMNVAMPDESGIYWLTSVPPNSTWRFRGTWPRNASSRIKYCSLQFNDEDGWPTGDSDAMQASGADTFDITVHTGPGSVVAIMRYYTTDDADKMATREFLPMVWNMTNPTLTTVVKRAPLSEATSNARTCEPFVQQHLAMRAYRVLHAGTFYKPGRTKVNGMLPNRDAEYLMMVPPVRARILRIELKSTPYGVAVDPYVRYAGFMAANLDTTATDDSMSIRPNGTGMVLWACAPGVRAGELSSLGAGGRDSVLRWRNETPAMHRVVVYRVVDQSCRSQRGCQGLARYAGLPLTPSQTERVLGKAYPHVTAY